MRGVFTPSPDSRSLTRTPHITRDTTPVIARFSSSTGLPLLPDNELNCNPRGLAIRLALAEHVHTDIISLATGGFPARTGHKFLELLRASAASGTSKTSIEAFLAAHPAALAFVQTPKPTPACFARRRYFGVTALRFIHSSGAARSGRYRITPDASVERLSATAASARDADFLFDELSTRIDAGPIGFQVSVQVAQEGAIVDDATAHWPEDRELAPFGSIRLTGLVENNDDEQRRIIFHPSASLTCRDIDSMSCSTLCPQSTRT